MTTWHAALKDVNKDAKRVGPNVPKVAYFFPSPSLFMRGESSNCQQLYLRNWLASQAGWITSLSASDVSPVIPWSWWDFLNTTPTQISSTFSGDQLCESAALFSPKLINLQHDIPSHVQFQDISISLADLATIDQMTKSKILWDLYEHNFCFKLVALDHAMMPSLLSNQDSEQLDHVQQIFPGDSEFIMCAEPFPQQNQGLGSSNFQLKQEYIEKLWALLAVWPGCPSDLAEPIMPLASLLHVWAMEKKLAIFYVQPFFDTFGCLPLLPHLIPTAPHGYGSNSW
ncbi:hypothetical protein F5J12DRAFT_898193 [Pisolithus orientalis]|uniref:uncharacterized protein n=1 Tax=Pisolithus orientalis TaxID=936130 RepID=UPI0022257FF5|nr:uncharacterized protein F5J12DRAFT_898193 [Pisolithus orientalis]KAI5988462.1 hypothetical protein F5J12DRAFT_898193 [Pisolithus orientalis]